MTETLLPDVLMPDVVLDDAQIDEAVVFINERVPPMCIEEYVLVLYFNS